MRPSGVIHPELVSLLATAGHGDRIVITDAGLRIPSHARRVDLGLTCGVPTVAQVLAAIKSDLVIEAAEVAEEFSAWAPETYAEVVEVLDASPTGTRSHVDLMADMAQSAFAYVKTGDCAAYSSVVLTCGVSYLESAIAHYTEVHGRPPAL